MPDEMRVVLSDAPREHGNRGVCHSVHNAPPFKRTTYAPNSFLAMVRREYAMSICGREIGGDRSGHCSNARSDFKLEDCSVRGDKVELSLRDVSPIKLDLGERTGIQSRSL